MSMGFHLILYGAYARIKPVICGSVLREVVPAVSMANHSVAIRPHRDLAGNVVFTIIKDKKGNLWFGTHDGGVSRLNQDGSFTKYTAREGLASDHVSSILADKNGNIWFGTWGDGCELLGWKIIH
jgi:ligand-binding sensor domain-containing protein